MGEMLEAGEKFHSGLRNLIVWDKGTGGMGSFCRSRHELIFAFKKGTAPHIYSFDLGQHGRYPTNVRCDRGMNSFGAASSDEIQLHLAGPFHWGKITTFPFYQMSLSGPSGTRTGCKTRYSNSLIHS